MADYLSNLLNRSHNLAQVVRPRPTALFEPVAGHHEGAELMQGPFLPGARQQEALPPPGPDPPVRPQVGQQGLDDTSEPPAQRIRRHGGRETPLPVPVVPQPTQTRSEHALRRRVPGSPEWTPPTLVVPMAETRSVQRLGLSQTGPVQAARSPLDSQEAPRRLAQGETTAPPKTARGKADILAPRDQPAPELMSQPGAPAQTAVLTAPSSLAVPSQALRPVQDQSAIAAHRPTPLHVEPTVQPYGESAPVSGPTPTIRVTIGRVEVRAITPPVAPPPRSQPAKTGPALSLDDYLKQRSEGGR